MSGRPLVAVFGSSTIRESGPEYREAEELGRRLAAAGADVITGGYGGAMAACSRGAHEAGAHVVGVTVDLFESRAPVNRWVTERVHTRDLFERLRHIIGRADAFIAVSGSVGTVAEILLTWNLLMAKGHASRARPRAARVVHLPAARGHPRAGRAAGARRRCSAARLNPATAARGPTRSPR